MSIEKELLSKRIAWLKQRKLEKELRDKASKIKHELLIDYLGYEVDYDMHRDGIWDIVFALLGEREDLLEISHGYISSLQDKATEVYNRDTDTY